MNDSPFDDHEIAFSTAKIEHGQVVITDTRKIRQGDILRCPHVIMVASHYRDDGTCKCDDPEEQAMMIKKWGYKRKDFQKVKR